MQDTRHTVYVNSDKYPIAILVKDTAFFPAQLRKVYVDVLEKNGISKDDLILVALRYDDADKAPVKWIKERLNIILEGLASISTKYIYCADAAYFKVLTKARKAEPNLGYSLPCKIKGYEHMTVILGVNHKSLLYNPNYAAKLDLSIQTLIDVVSNKYQGLGNNIIKSAQYLTSPADIERGLDSLYQHDALAIDIETGSLDFDKAGIATITFCWNEHEGIAFACDYVPNYENRIDDDGFYGELVPNQTIRDEIKRFLIKYKGTTKWHNSPYDLGILIYELWMYDLLDTDGLLEGLEVVTRDFQDTKVIAYLAINSTAGNRLSLKELAHPFAGNYAKDEIKDIRKIPLPELLEYNLIDGLCTNWVYNKYYPIMVKDDQLDIYQELMMPSQKMIIQVELTGMPLDPKQIPIAKKKLKVIVAAQQKILDASQIIGRLTKRLRHEKMIAANLKLKVKQHKIDHFSEIKFNPGSAPQKVKLVYEEMGLPVLSRTKGKKPSTKGEHIEVLVNHTKDVDKIAVLKALIMFTTADKILSTFIPAFEAAIDKGDGVTWLHGRFNLNGTVSGRLSSSDPNLQNLPASSTYAKLIKACFVAPAGWLFCGSDFNSLEDIISALTTKDPNKLKVYIDGYNGHCLRAFSYFPELLPGIIDTLDSINSIKQKFPTVRQDSKAPTFLLTYGGTWRGMMKNLGWTKAKAKKIEKNYHTMYAVADKWVKDKLHQAAKDGYVTVAFGLRLRTPLLAQTILGNSSTPYEAEKEGRTAGNALGQSYCMLNNRATIEFMKRVWASEYRLDIKPIALIHDAIYLVIRDNINIVEWVNTNLIECMEWQDLPELQHDVVKVGAELSIFWPDWSSELVIPNKSTNDEIRMMCDEFILHLEENK